VCGAVGCSGSSRAVGDESLLLLLREERLPLRLLLLRL